MKSFRWSDLESSDYRTYIANLRRIGCPEQTIRDIIVADIHGVYASGSLLERTGLNGEELAVVRALLGDEPEQGLRPAAGPRPIRRDDREIEVPLALRDPLPGFAVDAQQRETLCFLRERFQQELGTVPDNLADPSYAERWRKAQRDSDDMLAGLLGGEFYLRYELGTQSDER